MFSKLIFFVKYKFNIKKTAMSGNSDDEILNALRTLLEGKNEEIRSLKNVVLSMKKTIMHLKGESAADISDISEISTNDLNCSCSCHEMKSNDKLDAFSQTFESEFVGTVSTDSALDWATPEGATSTVSDLVQEVFNENNFKTDYVYDENSKMYHSPSTGYYYDHDNNLLYDPFTKTYYKYDQSKNCYEFVYQYTDNGNDCAENVSAEVGILKLDDNVVSAQNEIPRKKYKKRKQKASDSPSCKSTPIEKKDILEQSKPKKKESQESGQKSVKQCDSSPEEGEILSDSSESFTIFSYEDPSLDSGRNLTTDQFNDWPPCIRAIVKESQHNIIGSLLLIPCTGGVIGREKTNDFCVPDTSVSRAHAKVLFDEESWIYSLVDQGSQNGTFLNDNQLAPNCESTSYSLKHGDHVTLGSCKLLIHIHQRNETCNECEPGQVQAELALQKNLATDSVATIKTREDKERERKQCIKDIKKKFGLKDMDYEGANSCPNMKLYQDRADRRRKLKGSQNPYEKNETASTEIALSESNKGYKMLKTMGWADGQSLGMNNSGTLEPVPLHYQVDRTGVGGGNTGQPNLPVDPKKQKWAKAQKRYYETENVPVNE